MTGPDEELPEEVTDLVVRPGTPEDVDAVHAVLLAAGSGPGHPPERRTPEESRAWLAERVSGTGSGEHQELWVAERDGRVLGFVTMADAWVPLLFVDPDHQGEGVGHGLVELVKALRPDGFGLRVHQDNTGARAFYRRQGLVELESTDGSAYDDGWPDTRLAWPGHDPLAWWRSSIDDVDDELAVLLARRTALTAAVQDLKAAGGGDGGRRGRDPEREAEIVRRMSAHAPGLGTERLARVMDALITESLAAWEDRQR
ncbi:Chorismate mutase [Nocardioides scoriae]|uniref:Chorismate mutase n=1 Tax=Nocardioides scoriae TaxID=642780 RepID=A0A1H1L8D1_9ACTN|nr:GNAT family N-acetyltransferase [Nocardioides scoriae]SDR70844.1 Chorismate mutase [Nocardioides scoriae]